MDHLSIDIETFSSVDIKKSGLYKYVQSPDFEILLFAYSINFGTVQVVDLAQGEKIPADVIYMLQDPSTTKHAYNAAFEWYCLSKYFDTPLYQWQCTMLHSLYCGYPAGLENVTAAMDLTQDKRKMSIGKALIKTFCKPCEPKKSNGYRTRTLPHHEPDKWDLFKEYNRQDVIAEMAVLKKLENFPVPQQEQYNWQLDQIINTNGIMIDQQLVDGAIYCNDVVTNELTNEARSISGLDNPKSVSQLKSYIEKEIGEELPDLTKNTVKELMKTTDNETVKRMLEIRQELSKTSVKKYIAMKETVCADSRTRGLLQFYGANRTGRWAGRLVQVQNLPRNNLETLDGARELVKSKNVNALKLIYGNVSDTLSQLIRTAFIPAPGNIFAIADFSAIEARIIAWLAGEQWRLDVFATHGKIYEASASQMFGVPIEKITKGNPEYELRQKGKIAELALGYQGSTGALLSMGAVNMGIPEEELPEIVQRWRASNPRIVDLWYSAEKAAIHTVKTGQPTGVRGLIFAREIDSKNKQDFLTITLPSKRKLYYAKPTLGEGRFGNEAIFYYGIDQESKKWTQIQTYGGKLVENCVQAIARDCLAENMMRLHNAGYKIVMHIHDEVVLEIPEEGSEDTLKHICDIMGQPLSWAPGLLLKADGFVSKYYKKD